MVSICGKSAQTRQCCFHRVIACKRKLRLVAIHRQQEGENWARYAVLRRRTCRTAPSGARQAQGPLMLGKGSQTLRCVSAPLAG